MLIEAIALFVPFALMFLLPAAGAPRSLARTADALFVAGVLAYVLWGAFADDLTGTPPFDSMILYAATAAISFGFLAVVVVYGVRAVRAGSR